MSPPIEHFKRRICKETAELFRKDCAMDTPNLLAIADTLEKLLDRYDNGRDALESTNTAAEIGRLSKFNEAILKQRSAEDGQFDMRKALLRARSFVRAIDAGVAHDFSAARLLKEIIDPALSEKP